MILHNRTQRGKHICTDNRNTTCSTTCMRMLSSSRSRHREASGIRVGTADRECSPTTSGRMLLACLSSSAVSSFSSVIGLGGAAANAPPSATVSRLLSAGKDRGGRRGACAASYAARLSIACARSSGGVVVLAVFGNRFRRSELAASSVDAARHSSSDHLTGRQWLIWQEDIVGWWRIIVV